MTTPHPAVTQLLRWFSSAHLPGDLAVVVGDCYTLAEQMVDAYPDGGPELTAGLRHLLEAKDCFVRAAITQRSADQCGEEIPDPARHMNQPPADGLETVSRTRRITNDHDE